MEPSPTAPQDFGLDDLARRHDARLLTILRVTTPSAALGALSTIPAGWAPEPYRSVGMVLGASMFGLLLVYGLALWLHGRDRVPAARAWVFGGWLAFEAVQIASYRPDLNHPAAVGLYLVGGTAMAASTIAGIAALERFPRAWAWIGAAIAVYIASGAFVTWRSTNTPEDAALFAMSFALSGTFLTVAAAFQFTFGRDLATALQASELRRSQVSAALAAADHANAAKSQFLANMSHELRTPLSGILGYTELIGEELEEAGALDVVSEDLRRVRSAATHLHDVINDVLDLSKIEAGKLELSGDVVDVRHLVQDVVATALPMAQRRGIQLGSRHDLMTRSVVGDTTRVRQVLLNLLSNATKFTESGSVELMARNVGEQVLFEVRDTGIGIAPEHLERIFQPFEQVDGGTTRRIGGTGLGLAISARLASMMGGSLTAESRLGEGSTFRLLLPAASEEALRRAADAAASPRDRPAAGTGR